MRLALISNHESLNREDRWSTTDDFCNQFPPFYPVLHCPMGYAELQACPFLDVVSPPLFVVVVVVVVVVCLVFFHLSPGLVSWFWSRTEDMSITLQSASLYDCQKVFVWSYCLLDWHRLRW